MNRLYFWCALPFSLWVGSALAADSIIFHESATACVSETERDNKLVVAKALLEAKKKASAKADTRIRVESTSTTLRNRSNEGEDFNKYMKTLSRHYTNASVKEVSPVGENWYQDPKLGQCVEINVKLEVVPKDDVVVDGDRWFDDPRLPLRVQIQADRGDENSQIHYKKGEQMRFVLRGNKPFYAKVFYTSANGEVLQVLPNKWRRDDYFSASVPHFVPVEKDEFIMEVGPPYGIEKLTVVASESPLGKIDTMAFGPVMKVNEEWESVRNRLRGIEIKAKSKLSESKGSEFYEHSILITTGP